MYHLCYYLFKFVLLFVCRLCAYFIFRDGRIALDGSYQDLLNKDSSFAEFIKVHINDLSSEVVPNLAAVSESTRRFSSEIESIPAVGSVSIGRRSADWRSEAEELVRRRALSACSSLSVEEGRFSPNTSLQHHRTVRRPKVSTFFIFFVIAGRVNNKK